MSLLFSNQVLEPEKMGEPLRNSVCCKVSVFSPKHENQITRRQFMGGENVKRDSARIQREVSPYLAFIIQRPIC